MWTSRRSSNQVLRSCIHACQAARSSCSHRGGTSAKSVLRLTFCQVSQQYRLEHSDRGHTLRPWCAPSWELRDVWKFCSLLCKDCFWLSSPRPAGTYKAELNNYEVFCWPDDVFPLLSAGWGHETTDECRLLLAHSVSLQLTSHFLRGGGSASLEG